MLLVLRTKAQFVNVVEDFAQIVAALNFVLDLAENLSDFVFNGVRPACLLFEALQVRKELAVYEVAEVVAS